MNKKQFIGAKPIGFIGKIAGELMNLIHKKQYQRIIDNIKNESNIDVETIVDIGCGGGVALKHFASIFKNAIVIGIDYSQEMVNLSIKINRDNVKLGRVIVKNNNIECMDVKNKYADIITIFDNINFWENYEIAFKEIKRILKVDGLIYIINGFPKVGTKWYDFVKFKNEAEYINLLTTNGIEVEKIDIINHTIIIKGRNLTTAST